MTTINDRLTRLEQGFEDFGVILREMVNTQREHTAQIQGVVDTQQEHRAAIRENTALLRGVVDTQQEHTALLRAIVATQQEQSVDIKLIKEYLG